MLLTREIVLTLPRPHASQQRVLEEAARFNVVSCGRRWGKTTLSLNEGTRTILAGKPYGYFAPTYKNLAESWRVIADRLEPVTRRRSEQEHRIEAITGGVWECWSLDEPRAARGRAYATIGVDEAAHVPTLQDAWQHVLRPTLTDHAGSAWFYSTPNGLNYFHTLYQYGQDPAREEWRAWRFPSTDNPFLPAGEVELARQELPERVFAQEYEAAFLEDGGGIFRGVRAAATATPQTEAQRDHHGDHQYVLGVDWGKFNDFTALVVLDVTTHELVALDRFNQIDWSLQLGRLHALVERFRPHLIVAERNSIGDPLLHALQERGLPVWGFLTTNATKHAAIEALALAIERHQVALLDEPVLLGELQAYRAERLPSGLLRYSAPEGQHDDCVMALAMAVQGIDVAGLAALPDELPIRDLPPAERRAGQHALATARLGKQARHAARAQEWREKGLLPA